MQNILIMARNNTTKYKKLYTFYTWSLREMFKLCNPFSLLTNQIHFIFKCVFYEGN